MKQPNHIAIDIKHKNVIKNISSSNYREEGEIYLDIPKINAMSFNIEDVTNEELYLLIKILDRTKIWYDYIYWVPKDKK